MEEGSERTPDPSVAPEAAPEVAHIVEYAAALMSVIDAGEDAFRATRKLVDALRVYWRVRAEAIAEEKERFRWRGLWGPLADAFGDAGTVGDLDASGAG